MRFTKIQFPPPSRGGGCLLGCFGLFAILLLPFVVTGIVLGWFVMGGWRRGPMMRAVGAMLRDDARARAVMGDDIRVTGMLGNFLSSLPGRHGGNAYLIGLEGPKGRGTVAVKARNNWWRAQIEAMVLTGPDGRHHDLMHDAAPPAYEVLPPQDG